jgi:hypothetical protein
MERWFDRTGGRVRSRSRNSGFASVWRGQAVGAPTYQEERALNRDPADRTDMLKDGWKSVGSGSLLQRAEKERIHMNLNDCRSS